MSNSFDQQLTHPELMSKEAIIKVLKTRCIEMPDTNLMSKEELLNIFRRIALPLPQRDYSEAGHLGKKMASLRVKKCIPVASFESNKELEKLVQQNVLNGDINNLNTSIERLKPPIGNSLFAKKIQFTSSAVSENIKNTPIKRKNCNNSEVSPNKQKRQKITWP